jgi:hypothetical protein
LCTHRRRTHARRGAGRLTAAQRAGHGALYAVNMGSAYLLMLAAMTYNGGLFIATLAALGTAHAFFYEPAPPGGPGVRSEGCCEAVTSTH